MKFNGIDVNSRDYKFSDIKMDERFTQANKEVLIVVVLFLCHMAFLVINLIVGTSGDPLHSLTFGLPSWLVRQLAEFVVYIAIVFYLTTYVLRNMDVTPRGRLHPRKSK